MQGHSEGDKRRDICEVDGGVGWVSVAVWGMWCALLYVIVLHGIVDALVCSGALK